MHVVQVNKVASLLHALLEAGMCVRDLNQARLVNYSLCWPASLPGFSHFCLSPFCRSRVTDWCATMPIFTLVPHLHGARVCVCSVNVCVCVLCLLGCLPRAVLCLFLTVFVAPPVPSSWAFSSTFCVDTEL